jgi:cysteinyl-tRNA synthetase
MLKLYNSLTRHKDDFEPLNPPFAGVYVCGPTVYDHSHLGHGKSYVSFDVLVRYLRFSGYRVRYVQNITDVGHHVGDAESGEDKVQKQARLERLEPLEIAEKYTRSYFEDMDAMGLLRPDLTPRASGHIPEQMELVMTLLEKGNAYQVGGNVYFSVESFPGYGRLSGRKIDELVAGARVEVDTDKRDPRDFALWKDAGDDHLLRWRSPWGWGYPGWHLECSVMAMRYLGDTIDIHGGGLENIFPHHESEIAQSEAATGKTFARFWLHNNMVTVDGQKMGKSLGNYTYLKDIFRDFDPMVVRLYILRSHYRSPLDFSSGGLSSAQSGLERLVAFRSRLGSSEEESGEASPEALTIGEETETAFREAMDDDLNTPGALAALFDMVRKGNSLLDGRDDPADRSYLASMLDSLAGDVLGLDLRAGTAGSGDSVSGLCGVLGDVRSVLRSNRLFEEADGMRERLEKLGYVVKDLPDGGSEVRPR